MRKVKLIIHEKYAGKQSPSDVFAAVFLSDTAALTLDKGTGICPRYEGGRSAELLGRQDKQTMRRNAGDGPAPL